MQISRKIIPFALISALVISQGTGISASAKTNESAIAPHASSYGYYVDTYKNNTTANMTVSANPSIGVLSGYLDIWTPGTDCTNGTIKNAVILKENQDKVVSLTSNRTAANTTQAYLDDRRNQSYGIIDGLGKYTDAFKKLSGATTTISDTIPADATKVQYNDGGNGDSNSDWASETSTLGKMVTLVDTIRGTGTSTTPAKKFYLFPRPWRAQPSIVLPTLVPVESTTPATDYGFPSGHTNAAYLAAIALAYAFPERYQEMMTRASELGNDRIIAGMHSPLDVMGGRIMATAAAASILNDPANSVLKTVAYTQAQSVLLKQSAASADRFSDYAANKKNYTARLTYGFIQTGDKTKAMVVPKGAEVLLETRLPYLNAAQRRWVLYTTGLQSGYPLLDDAEGWGRLNLFSAAGGYGAFLNDVTVTMDASKGGFNASDSWRNDISGAGKLTKKGTGTLKLTGNNTYVGGTEIDKGNLEADSKTALGTGKVINNGGTLYKKVSGNLILKNGFAQSSKGTLELNVSGKADQLKIKGMATFGGTLKLDFSKKFVPVKSTAVITCGIRTGNYKFSSVVTSGLSKSYKIKVIYKGNSILLQAAKASS